MNHTQILWYAQLENLKQHQRNNINMTNYKLTNKSCKTDFRRTYKKPRTETTINKSGLCIYK